MNLNNDSIADPSLTNISFTNFTCSSGLSLCNESLVFVNNCSSYGGPLVLLCSFLGKYK